MMLARLRTQGSASGSSQSGSGRHAGGVTGAQGRGATPFQREPCCFGVVRPNHLPLRSWSQ